MKFLLKEKIRGEENTAGVKARDDIDEILIGQLGYAMLDYVTENTESRTLIDNLSGHFRKSRELEKATKALKNGDDLVVQFPMLADSIFHYRIFRKLEKRGIRVILIVHDLELFRVSKRSDVSIKKRIKNKIEEKNVLKCAGEIVVHNAYMRDALVAEGFSQEKMKILQIFDYLISGYDEKSYKLSEHIGFGKPVIIAGALRRHKAGYAYDLPEGCHFNLYGIGYEGESRDNVHYFGVFPPEDLPLEMEGSFGLVWDGLEADTCSGVYGEYLRINNPHKTSLYLAAGIPVIIWSEAALADYIRENNCGITVRSLKEIPDKLKEPSEQDYTAMKQNAGKAGERLREGYYTKQVIEAADPAEQNSRRKRMAYETLKPLDLDLIKEIQDVTKKSLYKLDEICKKHDIQYWAAYGTLLGAIRHKGFIPWDDDLDVCMMRDDFEKLCKVPAEEWGEEFQFCSPSSDDEIHDMPFGRVYVRNSQIQCYRDVYYWKRWSDGKPWSTKLILDIFIFDYLPDDDGQYQKIHNKLFPLLDKRYKLVKLKPSTNKTDPASRIKCIVKTLYSRMMRTIYKKPWQRIDRIYRDTVKSNPQGSRIGTYCTTDFNKYKYDDVFPLETAQFEEIMVPIPHNWEQMLIDMYGDYMQFPPESERGHLDLVYCDLGNGKKHIIDPIKGSLGENI